MHSAQSCRVHGTPGPRNVLRASFAKDRMTCLPRKARVIRTVRDGQRARSFHAIERLAAMGSRVPRQGGQMLEYWGCYSNVHGGKMESNLRRFPLRGDHLDQIPGLPIGGSAGSEKPGPPAGGRPWRECTRCVPGRTPPHQHAGPPINTGTFLAEPESEVRVRKPDPQAQSRHSRGMG